jgi:hypothetical protein
MCHGDLAATIWRYNEQMQMPVATLGSLHTCRNFDKIRDWALEHQVLDKELRWSKGPLEKFPQSV